MHPWPVEDYPNIYTDYKKPYPRFQAFIEGQYANLIVFPDSFFHLDPLKDNIVDSAAYSVESVKLSRQFNYSKDANALSAIPVPRLASLLQGLALKYIETDDLNMAICAEQLVDGMDLEKTWCLNHLDTSLSQGIRFIFSLIDSKQLRISQFEPNNITRFVANKEEASALPRIPGYNELSWSRDVQSRPIKAKRRSPRFLQPTLSYIRHELCLIKEKLFKWWSTVFCQTAFYPVAIQYVSDLHMEVGQRYEDFFVPKAAPYLVLAGDVGRLQDKGYLAFLTAQCTQFDRVFLVLGNHEFYGISQEDGSKIANSLEVEPQLHGKLSVLNRGRVDINRRVSILGCTLYSEITEESELWVRMKVADFSHIKDWTVEKHNAEHKQDVEWLRQEIQDCTQDRHRDLVIVTHHAPSFFKTADPKYKSNPWSAAFCTSLLESGAIKTWPGLHNIRRWIFGHTHWNTNFRKHSMIVSSNQLGYNIADHGCQKPQVLKFFSYFAPRLGQNFSPTKVAYV